MYDFKTTIENYKCFERVTLQNIFRVNVIIGKNNVGKSSLLDVMELISSGSYEYSPGVMRSKLKPRITFRAKVSEYAINQTFRSGVSRGLIGGDHREYGRLLIGREICWSVLDGGQVDFVACDDAGISPPLSNSGDDYANTLAKNMSTPLDGKVFKRVSAERDIVPEGGGSEVNIKSNGSGVTNAIQAFINKSTLPRELIEVDFLDALNEIFAHDATFISITSQLHDDGAWEVYLEEKEKGHVALSNSGSGLKTVIVVLSHLFILPEVEGLPLEKYVFGFEELENNIHPALLRRLNDYIYRLAKQHNFIYFLTTHSNVLIDQFSGQHDAQIVHVTEAKSGAECISVDSYADNRHILHDLDVRASDLLQSNGIIWVEGPSDRTYINKWIDLWSDGLLREGTHYQVIFYGGKLLSHLSADEPSSSIESWISLLNINRNMVVIIDSDKKSKQTKIRDTVKRIEREAKEMKTMCWITNGREIENYIPSDVVNQLFTLSGDHQVGQYDSFFEHLDDIKGKGTGKKYMAKKVDLAEQASQYMTLENMANILDIDSKMKGLCAHIKDWNGLRL